MVQSTPLRHAASAGASTAAYSRVHWLVCITSTQTRVRRTLCPFGRGYLLPVFADRGHPKAPAFAPRARGASGQTAPKSFVGNRLVSPSDMLKYTDEGVNVHVVCKASSTRY